jgi:hypothetical protein
VVVDRCSVRAKHGGKRCGPNPTDRGKLGPDGTVALRNNLVNPALSSGTKTLTVGDFRP